MGLGVILRYAGDDSGDVWRAGAIRVKSGNTDLSFATIEYSQYAGVWISGTGQATIHDCNFIRNAGYAVRNDTTTQVNAENCWWGEPAGPTSSQIYGDVDYSPWLSYQFSVRPHIFYNNSAWDGFDPVAGPADDAAIAPDKSALLFCRTATFANYTSYSRGINGLMIDIAAVAVDPTANDFTFKVGDGEELAAWLAAPAPTQVAIRYGAGLDGTDRVTITWADNSIQNEWLQVTVLSDAHGGRLGLAQDDVFYFGNAIGDTGNSAADAAVTPTDAVAVLNDPPHAWREPGRHHRRLRLRPRRPRGPDRLSHRTQPRHEFYDCPPADHRCDDRPGGPAIGSPAAHRFG